jgi:D-sedoheptulose 7-phosphate isomerase
MSFSKQHLDESIEITRAIDPEIVEKIVDLLADVKSTGGRLFVLGVGEVQPMQATQLTTLEN